MSWEKLHFDGFVTVPEHINDSDPEHPFVVEESYVGTLIGRRQEDGRHFYVRYGITKEQRDSARDLLGLVSVVFEQMLMYIDHYAKLEPETK